MYDRTLALAVLEQIHAALAIIADRFTGIETADDFASSSGGAERLDGICMQFMAVGEALKYIDKITDGGLLSGYPEIDWKGVMGFRDIIAHHYFDIDAEQVFWICDQERQPLATTIAMIVEDLRE